jgi:hypothetical protein
MIISTLSLLIFMFTVVDFLFIWNDCLTLHFLL